jgi:hypothetical protein
MPLFLNNCRRRDHAGIYERRDAFYDLYLTGRQGSMATDIRRGDECIVATPDENGDIEFVRYTFLHERVIPDENNIPARVFFGKPTWSRTLSKADAARRAPYSAFFNVNGHFKRPSVITPRRAR